MKTVNARDLQKKIKECVDMSQQDQVVITRRGKPAAILVRSSFMDKVDSFRLASINFQKLDAGFTCSYNPPFVYEKL